MPYECFKKPCFNEFSRPTNPPVGYIPDTVVGQPPINIGQPKMARFFQQKK